MYYYLVAGLPPVVPGQPPPFTAEDYRFKCQGVLTEDHLNEMDRILEGRLDDVRTDFARRWRDAETQIRNIAARIRSGREGIDESPYIRSVTAYSVAIEHGVSDALSKAHPLEQELALDRVRWRVLEELEREDPFGTAPALSYALKLRIVQRWAEMSDEQGRKYVEAFIDRCTHEILEDYKVETS